MMYVDSGTGLDCSTVSVAMAAHRKSVRFQDLSFIQESEEDQPEDVSASVEGPQLLIPSPNPQGGDRSLKSTAATTPSAAPGSSNTPTNKNNKAKTQQQQQQQQQAPLDPNRPASCPFGDRIAQERADKSKVQNGDCKNNNNNNNEHCLDGEQQHDLHKDAEDGKEQAAAASNKELPFPQNVIRLQEEEKKKLSKRKSKSAGVNPQAGKEKGSSFIITRNYLYGVTDNSTVLQPRNVHGLNKSFQEDADGVAPASSQPPAPATAPGHHVIQQQQQQPLLPPTTIDSLFPQQPYYITHPPPPTTTTTTTTTTFVPGSVISQSQPDVFLTNAAAKQTRTPPPSPQSPPPPPPPPPPCDVSSVSIGIPITQPYDSTHQQQQLFGRLESINNENNHLFHHPGTGGVESAPVHFPCSTGGQDYHQHPNNTRNNTYYKPDPSLSRFVNPFTAPNDQFYGSAAYGLKHTPQDTLTKPDVLKSSCVNQYLHCSSKPQSTVSHCRPSAGNQVVADEKAVLKEDFVSNNKNSKPNCQFLRDNFSVVGNTTTCTSITSAISHTKPCDQQQQPLQQQHTTNGNSYNPISSSCPISSAPAPGGGVIGPVYVSPRRQVLPSGSYPGFITDSHQRDPSPTSHNAAAKSSIVAVTTASSSLFDNNNNNNKNNSTVADATREATGPNVNPFPTSTTTTAAMNYIGNTADIYGRPVAPLSRFQEKEELQKLNDRFTSYVTRVRQLGQSDNNVDTSAFLRATKVLEDEIVCLKKLYESELTSLRQEIEAGSHERNSLHVQCTKHQKYAGEMQDRLAIESDKNGKLLDEMNILQRKMGNLEAEVQDARIASQRPKEEMDHLHRSLENLTRESDQWKHRYDHEQVARQETEDRLQQLMKKVEFNDQVQTQQIHDYQARLDTSAATILSLEGKVRELSTADVSVAEMLKQVRQTAETELKKYQIESEEQYSRNLSALKAQIDNDADSLSRYQTEKSQLMGNIGELQARIRNLEGQVQNMEHQKLSLEDAIAVERNRSADNIHLLEKKLRDVQDTLVLKMREITDAREANIPLKAEIETLKALMEEEEKRLRVPLGIVSASVVQTNLPATPSTKDILTSSVTNQVLKPRTPPNSVACLSAQPTSVGFVSAACSTAAPVAVAAPLPPPHPPVPRPSSGSMMVNRFSASPAQQQASSVALSAGTVNLTQSACAAQQSCLQQQQQQQQQQMVSNVNLTQAATSAAAAAASSQQQQQQQQQHQTTTTGCTHVSATYCYPPSAPAGSGIANPLYPYVPSPPLDTMYIPDALQTVDDLDMGTLGYDPNYGSGDGVVGFYDSYTPAFTLPMSGPRYQYEAGPSVNRLHVAPSPPPPVSPKMDARAKSAPACKPSHQSLATQISEARDTNLHLIPSDMGHGRDYFDEMFQDLQRDTLFSKAAVSAAARPKSSPLERPVPSTYHDYTVSTSSAIGDLKILEVNQEGKFVRLVNDGPTEFEFGGYMVQQNVGGHPVAVFRFPPRTKFPPDSTVTVWSALNDPHLHNPPTDFYWKEQHKWGTGPECTTILCRPNGQAVAWTTAAHRFTKDAFMENKTDGDDSNKFEYNNKEKDDDDDDEALKELTIDSNAPRPEPVYLRREKQQPPTLTAPKHPHGTSPTNTSHPHTGQARPLFYGNDNSSVSRQSRTQTTRPDPIPGQPYSGAPAQRVGSAPLRKMNNQGTIRTNVANRSSLEPGETSDSPSPFMRPHSRFDTGLEQVQSQHHPNFLPPMPRPPQATC